MTTRREKLELEIMRRGVSWWIAKEAVASTAIENPEWGDLDEEVDE